MSEQEYTRCYVAFLDIMGFEKKVIKSQDDKVVLQVLIDAMNICASIPTGGKKVTGAGGRERHIAVQSRFFSDSLVFFIEEKAEDLPHLLLVIRYMQDNLWAKGICLRGGIAVGGMYWAENDQNITFGPELIDAYKLESELAIYPRVAVSEELYAHLQGIDSYPFAQREGNLDGYARTDADGVHFLDLLNEGVTRKQGERLKKDDHHFSLSWDFGAPSRRAEVLKDVQETIKENSEHPLDRVRQKYAWLQSYLDSATACGGG